MSTIASTIREATLYALSVAELERIDRFEVIELLGSGGFATVWLAQDPVLDLQVAIKVLADNWSRDVGFRKRFIAEAKVLWETNSPRIIRVHHVGEMDDGRPYFVMAWANRGTLHRRMKAHTQAGTRFTVSEACSISAEVARAVGDVHDGGRIHRDIKPANILITTTDTKSASAIPGLAPDERLVLADFGLARNIDASGITFVSGSPGYVAPEQARGLDQLDEKVDLFPIGLIATELLSGHLPTDRGSMQEAATSDINVAEHMRLHGVFASPGVIELLQRLLAPDPRDRPDAATEVAEIFETFSAGAAVPETRLPQTTKAAPTVKRWNSPTVLGAAIAGIAVVAVGGIALLANGGDDPDFAKESGVATSQPQPSASGVDDSSTPSVSASSLAARSIGGNTTVPLPEIAVITSDEEDSSEAALAAPIQDVIDFYFDQTHDGWVAEPFSVEGDQTIFRMTSADRVADITLMPTAEAAGPGIVQIVVVYQSR